MPSNSSQSRIVKSLTLAAVVAVGAAAMQPVSAEPFRLLAWNVESNRPGSPPTSDPQVIAGQLVSLLGEAATRAQVVVLSEVAPEDVHTYRKAVARGLGADVDFLTSASGGFRDADSLLVVVDKERFEILDACELHRFAGIRGNFNVDDEGSSEQGRVRARSPLVLRLRERETATEFRLVAVHLARGEEDLRTDQGRMLLAWAKATPGPLVAAGDFNFDWDFHTRRGNGGFDAMTAGGTWEWLEPDPLIDSNWAGDRDDPSRDRYPDSILDFVFVAHEARSWNGESRVIVRPGDFPDDETTSDHRPILATFELPPPRPAQKP